MAEAPLHVFLHSALVGVAVKSRRRRVLFSYSEASPASLSMSESPISLSLPVGRHNTLDISDWMDGLLPDNPRIRARWRRELGAASVEAFDLLSTRAGMECAGAVQFHLDPVLPDPQFGTLIPLSESELAAMLRMISQDADGDPSPGMGDLRLSLAGAQAKVALRSTDDGWCLPMGNLATSHILKPKRGHLNPVLRESIAVNEYLCQTAAALVGLESARTSLARFEDETCLVTERFDRRRGGGELYRTHCEDLCQAMGFAAALRYQADGGPSPEAVITFLRREASSDGPRSFFKAAYYNWLIGNTDGHAKNYILSLDGRSPRLAPLYDLSSAVPYVTQRVGAGDLAMRFDGPNPETVQQWEQTAARCRIIVADGELEEIAHKVPAAFAAAVEQCPQWATDSAQTIAEMVCDHARKAAFGRSAPRRQAVTVDSTTAQRPAVTAADVGSAVREKRIEAGLTQAELADRTGTTRQWINRLEHGDHRAGISKVMAVLEELKLELAVEGLRRVLGESESDSVVIAERLPVHGEPAQRPLVDISDRDALAAALGGAGGGGDGDGV